MSLDTIKYRMLAACLLMPVLLVAGCGPHDPRPVKVRGTVYYQGKPLTNGAVIFSPEDRDTGRVANGRIDDQGLFTMSSFREGDGVLPGNYVVTVRSFRLASNANPQDPTSIIGVPLCIPERYSNPTISDLRCTIANDSAAQDVALELTDK